jgi:hypothetical protein
MQHAALSSQLNHHSPTGRLPWLGVLRDAAQRAAHVAADQVKFTRVYIPTLRGLRPLVRSEPHYAARTIKDYFSAEKWAEKESKGKVPFEELNVFTGLELFDEIRRHSHGSLSQRSLVKDYENYLAKRFFGGDPVTLIPREGDDVLHVKIGREAEKPIFHLGDGLQQLIILTIPLFIHRGRKLMLFVEEPENYLHPAYQRAFIDLVLDPTEAGERQVFVATHSNHFLDITLDQSAVSVYKLAKTLPDSINVEQTPTFTITNTSSVDFPLLAELGVRNSSVLLSNCTIWVEGITDRLYIRRYFELFQKEQKPQYLEDIHFSFVEYGGDNVEHWSFLDESGSGICVERLCGTLFLIADRDDGKGKQARHEALRKALNERFHLLPCREVENLILPDVLADVIKAQLGAELTLKPFKRANYLNKPLGTFIETRILPDDWVPSSPQRSKHPYEAASGTIRHKVEFAKAVIARTKCVADLSPEALKLCKEIYEFVARHNP